MRPGDLLVGTGGPAPGLGLTPAMRERPPEGYVPTPAAPLTFRGPGEMHCFIVNWLRAKAEWRWTTPQAIAYAQMRTVKNRLR